VSSSTATPCSGVRNGECLQGLRQTRRQKMRKMSHSVLLLGPVPAKGLEKPQRSVQLEATKTAKRSTEQQLRWKARQGNFQSAVYTRKIHPSREGHQRRY